MNILSGVTLDSKEGEIPVIELQCKKDCDYAELVFIGDVHVGSGHTSIGQLYDYIYYILKNPNVKVVLMGDLIEMGSLSRFGEAEAKNGKAQIADIVKLLTPIKDRIVVMLEGNHEERFWRLVKGTTCVTKIVANELGISPLLPGPERGQLFVVKVGNQTYSNYAIHGASAGIVNKATQLSKIFNNIRTSLAVHGHSLTGNRYVMVRDSKKRVKVLQLKDFYKIFKTDIWETPTLRRNESGSIERSVWSKVYDCWKTTTDEPTYLVRSQFGETEVTGKHAVYVKDESVTVKNAEDLKVGDMLIHMKKIPTAKSFDVTIHPKLAWMLGLFYADGSFADGSLQITQKDKAGLLKFQEYMKSCFPDAPCYICQRKRGHWQLTVWSKNVCDLFASKCRNDDKTKRIPEEIFVSSLSVIRSFLEGYYLGNGDKGSNNSRFKSRDEHTIAGICSLLHMLPEATKYRTGFNFSDNDNNWCLSWVHKNTANSVYENFKSYYISPIREIIKNEGTKDVYDLQVERDESFLDMFGCVMVHNTHNIFKDHKVFYSIKNENGKYYTTVQQQNWLTTGCFCKDLGYAEAKSMPTNKIGAPIVRYYKNREALEIIEDPRITYGIGVNHTNMAEVGVKESDMITNDEKTGFGGTSVIQTQRWKEVNLEEDSQ